MQFYGKLNKTTKDKTNSMTPEEFLGMIIIISMLGMLIAGVIWWIGKDIIHELRYQYLYNSASYPTQVFIYRYRVRYHRQVHHYS